ncbi:MAG: A24 family peptidase [Candidatus Nanohaloarchaea archaeon]|nr:A24 family peptidase [Candidatus Nanohaloarchaea archaeon]
MLGHAFVLAVLAGTAYAAYLDLRTSEVPDWVSIGVAAVALLYHGYRAVATGSIDPLLASVLTGTGLFLAGWAMYIAGLWGGADAFVLGAVGYALPAIPPGFTPPYTAPWPTPFSLLLTVFLVGAVYSLAYAVVTAARSDGFRAELRAELDASRARYARVVVLYTVVAGAGTAALYTVFRPPLLAVARNFAASLLLLAALLGLTVFLRTVESRVMEREVPVEQLQPGDVPAEDLDLETGRDDPAEDVTDRVVAAVTRALPVTVPAPGTAESGRIAGLTEEQVEELQERRDTVPVRSGVRFIPSFPAAVLILVLFGDPVYFLVLQAL